MYAILIPAAVVAVAVLAVALPTLVVVEVVHALTHQSERRRNF